jgi:cellulose synthase/poly-beta-1,6-N-acetylglucosamine synthase-like glycosyltransferase
MPPVSVITVVHNGMPYLPATVESVLSQTFVDFEYVIVDDGSTDGTAAYLSGLVQPRIRVVRREKIGLANARNVAVREARGELLANVDADDLAYPERLAKQVDFLRHSTDHVLVGSQADLIDPQGRIVGERRFPRGDAALRFQILFGCPFLHPTTTYRREATLRCGGFRPEYDYTEDYELWARLALEGRMANLDEKLAGYRIHPTSVTSRHSDVHTEHSCQLVAEYAQRLQIGVPGDALAALFRFLQSGQTPPALPMTELADCYRSIRSYFLQADSTDHELWGQTKFIQQRLRWHCLESAKRSLPNALHFWSWLRLAGEFDPEDGTLCSIGRRAVQNLFKRSGARRSEYGPLHGEVSNAVGVG